MLSPAQAALAMQGAGLMLTSERAAPILRVGSLLRIPWAPADTREYAPGLGATYTENSHGEGRLYVRTGPARWTPRVSVGGQPYATISWKLDGALMQQIPWDSNDPVELTRFLRWFVDWFVETQAKEK